MVFNWLLTKTGNQFGSIYGYFRVYDTINHIFLLNLEFCSYKVYKKKVFCYLQKKKKILKKKFIVNCFVLTSINRT